MFDRFSVVFLCGSIDFVSDIMVAAHKLGFLNGEYAFINFDLYAQMHHADRLARPWKMVTNKPRNVTDSSAMAYEGLLTVTLKVDDTDGQYQRFQKRLSQANSHIFSNESEVC
jgi:hypothetical protein